MPIFLSATNPANLLSSAQDAARARLLQCQQAQLAADAVEQAALRELNAAMLESPQLLAVQINEAFHSCGAYGDLVNHLAEALFDVEHAWMSALPASPSLPWAAQVTSFAATGAVALADKARLDAQQDYESWCDELEIATDYFNRLKHDGNAVVNEEISDLRATWQNAARMAFDAQRETRDAMAWVEALCGAECPGSPEMPRQDSTSDAASELASPEALSTAVDSDAAPLLPHGFTMLVGTVPDTHSAGGHYASM
ncbi:hypothetical protein [Comamonas antarctica]|uniref:hypothetical protein n=1 Tax=Comamonas antarctica TaxID=2743470 RepID=UPI0028E3ABD4|nr:hypothetical protein [Comamonas antarctica]